MWLHRALGDRLLLVRMSTSCSRLMTHTLYPSHLISLNQSLVEGICLSSLTAMQSIFLMKRGSALGRSPRRISVPGRKGRTGSARMCEGLLPVAEKLASAD